MSDSESSDSESDVEVIREPQMPTNFMARLSDDEEDAKRVVRSAKVKRYEELNSVIKNIKNYRKNKDLANLHSSKYKWSFLSVNICDVFTLIVLSCKV